MKEYELTREIFNKCSGNQMRDVFISEIILDENKLEDYVRNTVTAKEIKIERSDLDKAVVFDIEIKGERQRMTFCEIQKKNLL